jgi:phosphatidylglycerophosphatase B
VEQEIEPSKGAVLKRLVLFVVPAALLLPGSFLLPKLPLDGSLAQFVYWLSESGGKPGIPVVAAVLLTVLLTRPGFAAAPRVREAIVLVVSLGLVVGLAAVLNEHVVKPGFAVPRPNIKTMAERDVLGTTPDAFYALGDKDARRLYLAERVKTPEFVTAYRLHPAVLGHWVHETGFSFPSGHSLASMTFATYFLALALWLLKGPRAWIFFALPTWGVLVCYSRVLLTVHSPTDVSVGGGEGVLIGVAGFVLARWLSGKLPVQGSAAVAEGLPSAG